MIMSIATMHPLLLQMTHASIIVATIVPWLMKPAPTEPMIYHFQTMAAAPPLVRGQVAEVRAVPLARVDDVVAELAREAE